MIFKTYLITLSIFTLMMCQSQPRKEKDTTKQANSKSAAVFKEQNTITLKEGENIFLKDSQMNVTFKKVIEDSRCPVGTQCIWEGVATAEIEVMSIHSRPMILTLNTMDHATKGYSKSKNFNGQIISLVSLTPVPTSSKGFENNKGNHTIVLKVEKEKPAKLPGNRF